MYRYEGIPGLSNLVKDSKESLDVILKFAEEQEKEGWIFCGIIGEGYFPAAILRLNNDHILS